MFKKILIVLVLFSIIIPFTTGAQSVDGQSVNMADLEQRVSVLQERVKMYQQSQASNMLVPAVSAIRQCYLFNQNLGVGASGLAVRELHLALAKEGFPVASVQLNFSENENNRTDRYTEATAAAVSQFQLKYRNEILTPSGLSAPTGYFGPSSRAKMNRLYGCNDKVPITKKPAVTIFWPAYGAELAVGQRTSIKWLVTNPGNIVSNDSFRPLRITGIFRSASGMAQNLFDIPFETKDGWYDWTPYTMGVSDNPSNTYFIDVCLYRSQVKMGENWCGTTKFEIVNGQPPIPHPEPIPNPMPAQPLTVTSPNGGENWQIGTSQLIQWGWKTNVFVDQKFKFTIYLDPVPTPCPVPTTGTTTTCEVTPQWKIASDIAGTSYYKWKVGKTTSGTPPAGAYYVQICAQSNYGSYVCDRSDSYFKIYDSDQPGNNPPTISEVNGPTTLKVGEQGKWKVKASDPENSSLSYSVFWGDEPEMAYTTSATPTFSAVQQTATFTHTYTRANNYYPKFKVTDDKGQSNSTILSVKVGDVVAPISTGGAWVYVWWTEGYLTHKLNNAKVWLLQDTGIIQSVREGVTAPAGAYNIPSVYFGELKPGRYYVKSSVDGYTDGQSTIFSVEEGKDASVTVDVRPILSSPVACPSDARVCANGTSVWRVGPSCDFAACP